MFGGALPGLAVLGSVRKQDDEQGSTQLPSTASASGSCPAAIPVLASVSDGLQRGSTSQIKPFHSSLPSSWYFIIAMGTQTKTPLFVSYLLFKKDKRVLGNHLNDVCLYFDLFL